MIASEQAHFSVEKAARILGLELRTVPVDDEFRMLTDFPLDDATAVVATVGTTSTTSVDPVPALADRCEEAGVWLHVDAAYAGSAAVCPELRWCLEGVDRADSIVVNPHKWLFTPVDCSTLWTRRPESFRKAFGATRRLHGSHRGRDRHPRLRPGARAPVPRAQALGGAPLLRRRGASGADPGARAARRALRGVGARRARAGRSRPRGTSRRSASATRAPTTTRSPRRATESGRIFVATTRLRGRSVIRLAIGNGLTSEEDVRIAWEVLRECAR